MPEKVTVEIFSDVLCVWAYGAQARIDQLRHDFGGRVELHYRFIPLFAATHQRIVEGWKTRGGAAGFNRHLHEVVSSWDHVSMHPDVWIRNRPPSSNSAHLFLKAAQLSQAAGDISPEPDDMFGGRSLVEELAWRVRCAFFADNLNISDRPVLSAIAAGLCLPIDRILEQIDNGEAHAALHLDVEARDHYLVPGSPTFVFNEGRQRLYGNVGYRIIEANLTELLANNRHGGASWC